jgi:hypothetical protein
MAKGMARFSLIFVFSICVWRTASGFKLQASSFKLQASSFKLQASSFKLQEKLYAVSA